MWSWQSIGYRAARSPASLIGSFNTACITAVRYRPTTRCRGILLDKPRNRQMAANGSQSKRSLTVCVGNAVALHSGAQQDNEGKGGSHWKDAV